MRFLSLIAAALLAVTLLPAQAAPLDDARFSDLQGRPTQLSTLRGKVTVINFWATWCGPCREEMPMLNTLRQRLAGKGVEVVGIALDNKVEVNNFVRQLNINYPIWLGNSQTTTLMRALGNPSGGLPYTLVLDRRGNVAARLLGRVSESTLHSAIAARL